MGHFSNTLGSGIWTCNDSSFLLDNSDSLIAIDGRTPLHFAAQYGCLDVVKIVLASGKIEPGLLDNSKFTALHWAAAGGHHETVKLLLEVTHIVIPAQLNVLSPSELALVGLFPEVIYLLLSQKGVDGSLQGHESSTG